MSTNSSNITPIRSVIPGKIQPNRRELLWLAENKLCHWCGHPTRLTYQETDDQATIDHVIPRYKGGTNDVSNLVSACRGCNGRRNTEDMRGLPDGSLLKGNIMSRVFLSGDEKKALLARVQATPVKVSFRTEDVLREQRDQGIKEITSLRKELATYTVVVNNQEAELKAFRSMTVWSFMKKRIGNWLLS